MAHPYPKFARVALPGGTKHQHLSGLQSPDVMSILSLTRLGFVLFAHWNIFIITNQFCVSGHSIHTTYGNKKKHSVDTKNSSQWRERSIREKLKNIYKQPNETSKSKKQRPNPPPAIPLSPPKRTSSFSFAFQYNFSHSICSNALKRLATNTYWHLERLSASHIIGRSLICWRIFAFTCFSLS